VVAIARRRRPIRQWPGQPVPGQARPAALWPVICNCSTAATTCGCPELAPAETWWPRHGASSRGLACVRLV
jgi:hypothetical protein